MKLVLSSQMLGLNPVSACVFDFGQVILLLCLYLPDTDLEWMIEEGKITQAHNPLSETLGQTEARLQNPCYFIKVIRCMYDVLVNTHSRVCGRSLIRLIFPQQNQ